MSRKNKVNLLDGDSNLLINCHICGGQLLPALSCSPFTVEKPLVEKPYFVTYSAAFDRYYMLGINCFYHSADGATFTIRSTMEFEKSCFLEFYNAEGKPCYIAYNSLKSVMYDGENLTYPGKVLHMGYAVMHCGRAFFISAEDSFTLGWSAPSDILSFDQSLDKGGWIKLDSKRGEILKLFELGEKIVAVRKFGFSLINAMGSPENFKAEITQTDTDEIYPDTAQISGGKIIFYTASGLHSFDGSKIKKLPFNLEDEVTNVICTAAYAGKYYIDCTVKALNGSAIVCYDPDGGESYIMPIERAKAGCMCAGKDLRVYNDTGNYLIEKTKNYELRKSEVNFGSLKSKTVTEIYVDGTADVEISNGKISRKFYALKGKVNPHLRGESFSVTLKADVESCPSIRAFTLTAEECNAI